MATTRTDGTDPSKAVVEQMIAEKRRRKNQPKPRTVISQDQTVQGSSEQGGPNPNEEGLPVREPVEAVEAVEPEATEVTEEVTEEVVDDSEDTPEAEETEVERPDGTFGGKEAWRAFRLANGYTEEELKGKGRNALRDLDDR